MYNPKSSEGEGENPVRWNGTSKCPRYKRCVVKFLYAREKGFGFGIGRDEECGESSATHGKIGSREGERDRQQTA